MDFENPASLILLKAIYKNNFKNNFLFFVSKPFASVIPNAKIVIPSAVSGGSFEQMLRDMRVTYGGENICLDIVKSCQDFTMPSYMPEGKPLSQEEFHTLFTANGQSSFFSKDLCAKYFTYRGEGGTSHFVMYDDASTAKAKIEIAGSLGIFSAFLLYSDFGEDIKSILA